MEVGGACAPLQVKDLHGVGRIILENILAVGILCKNAFHIGLGLPVCMAAALVVVVKEVAQGRAFSVDHDLAGPVVDRAGQGVVDAAQVDDQLAVHIEPEIVVSGELIDDVVAPVVQAVRCLGEGGIDLHAQVIIRRRRILDVVELLVFPGVGVRQIAAQGGR